VAWFVASLWRSRTLDRNRLIVAVLYLLLLLVPGAIYNSLVFQVGHGGGSIAVHRGQGVDLITMFVPTQASILLARVLRVGPAAWDGFAFYGNGQNSTPNFVGVTGPALGLVTVILAAFKRLQMRRLILTLGIIWAIGFVMSLGPSLKVDDTRPTASIKPGFTVWEMPAEDATLALPTAFLFKLPVLQAMRYTYRWQLMSRFALVALVGIAAAQLSIRRTVLAAILSVVVVLENMPAAVLAAQIAPIRNREWGQELMSEVVMPLRPYVENSRVLLLPAANDYLISMIAPFTKTYSYNLTFDKEIKRIKPLQPPLITAAERAYNRGELDAGDVCRLFKKGLVDKVVLLYIRMNAGWPQSPRNVEANRQMAANLHVDVFPGLVTHEESYFLVVSSDPQSGKCSTP
jgi:hypothetical protein